jgi:hypothetical protein
MMDYKLNDRTIALEEIEEIVEACINSAFKQVQDRLKITDGGGMFDTSEAEQAISEAICINIEHNGGQGHEHDEAEVNREIIELEMRKKLRAEILEEEKEKMKHEIYADVKDQLTEEIRRDLILEMEAKQIFSLPDCKMQDGQTITITVSTK